MLRSLYTLGNGMVSQYKRVDVIANNVANFNTKAFKKDVVIRKSFNEHFLSQSNPSSNSSMRIGGISLGNRIHEVKTIFEQGQLEETKRTTDIAINGEGFFVINTPKGERFSRNGFFTVDSDGYLATQEGWRLLGENGDIYVTHSMFKIEDNGEIFIGDEYIDKIKIIVPNNLDNLRKEGFGLYTTIDEQAMDKEFAGEIKQGFLEESNVNYVKEITDLLEANRNYESGQRMIKMIDDIMAKSVNEIARF